MPRTLLVAALCALLAGCGFQLRGAGGSALDVDGLYVRGPGAIRDAIAIEAESGGARMVDSRAEAKLVISMLDERFDRRVLSVDARTGKQREIELTYVTDFTVHRASGDPLLGSQRVTLLRDYVSDADAVLGKSREEDTLKDEMRRDAAQQVIRRVQRALE